MRTRHFAALLALVLPLAACGGAADARSPEAATEVAAATPAAPAVQPTGTVIEVKMITDDKGNYFEPSAIEAKPGDVIRLVLVSGVHNFSLPADRNPAGLTLPPATDLLQLPGQTVDITVDLPPGEYFFQCDPHALLGMVGTLTVVE
jgi:plastocyanin